MTTKQERRSRDRCLANCQCWIEQESLTLFGTVMNLSEKGLFLQTLPLIETGTEIEIRLILQDVGDLHAKGKIRWKRNSRPNFDSSESEGTPVPGLGIEFSKILKGAELLPHYIQRRSLVPPPEKNNN